MRLRVLLIAFVSVTLAKEDNAERRSARAPQGQIKYSDPNGLKVNWRFFAPQNQWRSQLENVQRAQRAESDTAYPHQQQSAQPQPQSPVAVAQSEPNQQQYRPYSAVPTHIKQLLVQNYEQQRPYVDQSAFLYNSNFAAPGQYDQQPATAEVSSYERQQPADRYPSIEEQKFQSRRDYGERGLRGRIQYKDDYDQQEQQQEPQEQHIPVPIETMPVQQPPKLILDKNMPSEIQQLLQFQAQIPYDVIANRIVYKPKTFFIPKPLPDDAKGPHYYRSKIYYVKDDSIEPEYETSKPTEEDPRQ